jgi:NitT/TauT family transport system substrate-binding protein
MEGKRDLGRRDFLKMAAICGAAGLATLRFPEQAGAQPFLWEGRVTVTHWPGIPYGLPIAVGMDKGWFKKAGINITEIVAGKGGGHTLTNILAGGVPVGEVGSPAVVKGIMKGMPIMIVAAGVQTIGSNFLLVRKDSPIKQAKDLEGKTCGITNPGAAGHMYTVLSMQRLKVDVDKVAFRPTGGTGEGITALQKSGVDAFYLGEPTFSRLKEKGEVWWRVLYDIREVLPWFVQTFWVATKDFCEKNGDAIRRLLKVRADSVRFIQENLEEAAQFYASHMHIEPKMALNVLKEYDVKAYFSDGRFKEETLVDLASAMVKVKEIAPGQVIHWSKIVDQNFLPPEMRVQLPS